MSELTTIRILVSKDWSAQEFSQLYTSATTLYAFFALDENQLSDLVRDRDLDFIHRLVDVERKVGVSYFLGILSGSLSSALREEHGDLNSLFRQIHLPEFHHSSFLEYEIPYLLEALAEYARMNRYGHKHWKSYIDSRNWREPSKSPPSFQLLQNKKLLSRHKLSVIRTHHGSPGFTDLAGAAQIVGHLKEFLLHLVNLWATREERKVKSDILKRENEKKALEILEIKMDLLERAGCDKELLVQLATEIAPHIDFFKEATREGAIKCVESQENDG